MKLQTWNQTTTPRYFGGKPLISAFRTGRIGFSTKTLENLSLFSEEQKYVTFHQDHETGIWYVSISEDDDTGFLMRYNNGAIQSKFIANKMLLPNQDKCRFLLGEAQDYEGKTLYELIRLDRDE